MHRDLGSLQDRNFDIIIIGGGIAGAVMAWDASLRGLKTALIEKDDFGHATASATSKMIHGGLRYLANFQFKVVRESLKERRRMERIMPHLAFPLPFLLPVYKHRGSPKWMLRLGLYLYDALSFDKNFLDDPDKYLSNHRWYNKEETLAIEPNLQEEGLKGAFYYYDVQNRYTERANLEFVISAVENGAIVANHCKAVKILTTELNGKKTVTGVLAKDMLTDQEDFKISAGVVINATGPWAEKLIAPFIKKSRQKIIRSKGIHLLFPKILNHPALTFETEDRRHFFIIPWLNYTLIGTTDTPYQGEPDSVQISPSEIQEFLKVVNRHFPVNLTSENVLHAYAGLRPFSAGDEKTYMSFLRKLFGKKSVDHETYNITRRHEIIDHSKKEKVKGLYSVYGGKWTTSRALSQTVLNKILSQTNIPALKCSTDKTPVSGGRLQGRYTHWRDKKISQMSDKFTPEVARHIVEYYGANCDRLFQWMSDHPKSKRTLTRTSQFPIAQIEYAVKNEMAYTLSDFIMRRSLIGNTGVPPHETVVEIADTMAGLLGWSKKTKDKQIEEYFAKYRVNHESG